MEDEGRVTVGTKVDRPTRTKLRMVAAARDTTMSTILRDKIEEVIEESELTEGELKELSPSDYEC